MSYGTTDVFLETVTLILTPISYCGNHKTSVMPSPNTINYQAHKEKDPTI